VQTPGITQQATLLSIPGKAFIASDDILDGLMYRSTTMQLILNTRLNSIRQVRDTWREDAIKASILKLSEIRDSSVLADVLRILVLKPSLLSLDIAVDLLPLISELLFEIYEE
jgi:katanin p80 WD40 repeat-containing subunit B1